ncbi:MAG: hypothetical protein IPL61_23070 [Myxococcales bacterium]|nr:hypothetical protein [Myxococcales bacterium]
MVVEDSIFAAALGMSEADSLAVLTANASLFQFPSAGRMVADAVDLPTTVVTVPAGLQVVVGGIRRLDLTADDFVDVLAPHTARGQLVRGLATASGRDDDEVRQLVRLAGVAIDSAVASSIRDVTSGAQLETVIAAVSRVDVATRGWSAAGLAALADVPAVFGAGAWPILSPATPDLPRFTFAQATALGRAAARGTAPDRQDALVALAFYFDPAAATFAPEADAALAEFLGTTPATIAGLRGTAALPPGLIAALDRLAALVRIADRLGVDGGAVKGLVSDLDSERTAAAAAVEHAAELRAERDPAEATRLSDARAVLREQQRDALVDFLLHPVLQTPPVAPEFKNRLDLSSYLLIDVDAGGCATTSRVVAATNAVQEYVTRITLGLERNDVPLGAPGRVAVTMSDAGTRSWEWRRAYRVWEANRKVFLWPENYLEPSLRDNKTHLFTQLEDALGQSDLDEASILTAYATYLQGLDELASLKVAGAYHDVGTDSDVLHLIGVTPRDPATFYYRSVTDIASSLAAPEKSTIWGNWQKLDLSIPTRFVSPVVYQGRLSLLWTDVKTRPVQKLEAGDMKFLGYQHALSLTMAGLQPDGRWSPGQDVAISMPVHMHLFSPTVGVVQDPVTNGAAFFDAPSTVHEAPLDGYTIRGPSWGVWPIVTNQGVSLRYRNFHGQGELDVYQRSLTGAATWAESPRRNDWRRWVARVSWGAAE